jgi:hypothetical protein
MISRSGMFNTNNHDFTIYVLTQSVYSLTIDWRKGFRFPAEENDFCPSLCVWTSSEFHTASIQLVPGVLSPGLKRSRVVALTTHTHLVPRTRISRSYSVHRPFLMLYLVPQSCTSYAETFLFIFHVVFDKRRRFSLQTFRLHIHLITIFLIVYARQGKRWKNSLQLLFMIMCTVRNENSFSKDWNL